MQKIKWGIIGCGDVTEVKSGPALNKTKNSELVAVMRRNAAKAEDYARRHGVPKWYDDAKKLIDDPDVNAIYIATPPQSHEEYTIRAFEAGKPVYVEKPMSTDSASAERMLQASIDTGMKLSVAHYRKEQPRFKKIKALLDAGEIGKVRMVNLQLYQPLHSSLIAKTDEFWRVDPSISGGGLFHDLSPHQLDLMQYFFGDYKQASGFSLNQGGFYAADDLTIGTVIFNNGVVKVVKLIFPSEPTITTWSVSSPFAAVKHPLPLNTTPLLKITVPMVRSSASALFTYCKNRRVLEG